MGRIASKDVEGGINLSIELPPQEIARIQGMLKALDPNMRKSLSRDLNKSLKGIAGQIEKDFPPAPMSGLASRWGNVNASVRVQVNGPPQKALALFSVRANPPSFARLLAITERAGSRSPGLTPRGRNLIRNPRGGLEDRFPLVNMRGGRFVFASFFRQRRDVDLRIREAIDRFIDKVNKGS